MASPDITPEEAPTMALQSFLTILLAAIGGAVLALLILPMWLSPLASSLDAAEPKAFWYLSRASGLTAYVALWLSMMFGLLMTNKWAKLWPGGPTAFDLHQHTGLLGLAMAIFHALILMGDKYIAYTLVQVLVPFASTGYKPLWVGLGQLSLYGSVLVSLSFYVRKQITQKRWRQLHFLSFLVFLMALGHGLVSGTDSSVTAIKGMYWVTGASVLFMTLYRIVATRLAPVPRTPRSRPEHSAADGDSPTLRPRRERTVADALPPA